MNHRASIATFALVMWSSGFARGQATPLSAPDDSTVPPEIKEMRDGLVDSFNKRDVDRLLSYLHPDIVVTWQNGEVNHGREGVRQYYEKMMVGPNSIVVDIKSNPQVEV